MLDELREVTLQCWRLNCRGQFQVDHLVGSSPGSEGQIIPFLIHGGHIRSLAAAPNEKEEPIKVLYLGSDPGVQGAWIATQST